MVCTVAVAADEKARVATRPDAITATAAARRVEREIDISESPFPSPHLVEPATRLREFVNHGQGIGRLNTRVSHIVR